MIKNDVKSIRNSLKQSEFHYNLAYQLTSLTVENYLIESGKSLRAVAKELKISASFLSDMKNGKRIPSEKTLQKMENLPVITNNKEK